MDWKDLVDWAGQHLSTWTMTKAYIACAVAGGSVLLGMTGLGLFGLGGGDADVDADADVHDLGHADGGDHLNLLSIRALAGFLTFFGLVGWGGTASGWGALPTLLAASLAGGSVMLLVAWILRFFRYVTSEGNLHPADAVGSTAHVYLRVPAGGAAKGKIVLLLQGRSVEFDAITHGPELPSGAECRVVRMVSDTTFEVAAPE